MVGRTMEQVETVRDRKGRFVNGRPPGLKEKGPRKARVVNLLERQAILLTAAETVAAKALPQLEGVVAKLVERALEGDVSAANTLLRYSVVPVSRTIIRGMEGIAHLPPDQRIQAIATAVTAGQISTEDGAALTALARAEIESRVLMPLRAAVLALKAGKSAGEVLAQLSEVLDGSLIIEHANGIDSAPNEVET